MREIILILLVESYRIKLRDISTELTNLISTSSFSIPMLKCCLIFLKTFLSFTENFSIVQLDIGKWKQVALIVTQNVDKLQIKISAKGERVIYFTNSAPQLTVPSNNKWRRRKRSKHVIINKVFYLLMEQRISECWHRFRLS